MQTPAPIMVVSTLAYTTEAFLLPYIRHLQEMGYPVEVAANWKADWNRMPADIIRRHFPFTRSLFHPFNLIVLIRLVICLRKTRYAMIYTHTPIASALIRIAKRLAGSPVPILYEVHGFHFHQYGNPVMNRIYRWMESFLSGYTRGIITINTDDYRQAKQWMHATHIYHSPGIGIDPDYYRPENYDRSRLRREHQIPETLPVMITIADFIPRKRLDMIIQCAQALSGLEQDFLWIIIGTGPLEQSLTLQIEQAGLNSMFRLTGWQADIRPWLAMADIFVLLSLQEGLPRSLLEAGLMEIPCIVSNIRGNRDVVEHTQNSYLVPAENPLQTTSYILELIRNPSSASQMGKNLRIRICRSFSYAQTLPIHHRIFQECLTFQS
ncbi:MAG: glycosyltransferase [Candidatus Delongbacteria bacterium]|nr:glycosyltransferase [Candidatus Delongbacteria bacterium]